MRRLPLLLALPLLLLAGRGALAAVPESGLGPVPVPEAPSAPPSLATVIELLKKGDYPVALKGAREFAKSQPGNPAGQEVLGFAAQANRMYREAEAAYTESLRLDPGRSSVMLRLGHLALETREPKKAEGWFRKALAANPDLGAARRGLGVALLRQRQLGPALAEATKAVERDPADLDAKLLIAQIYSDAGQPAAAEALGRWWTRSWPRRRTRWPRSCSRAW
jgi:tetratricopeptide (TPR) repeat protein